MTDKDKRSLPVKGLLAILLFTPVFFVGISTIGYSWNALDIIENSPIESETKTLVYGNDGIPWTDIDFKESENVSVESNRIRVEQGEDTGRVVTETIQTRGSATFISLSYIATLTEDSSIDLFIRKSDNEDMSEPVVYGIDLDDGADTIEEVTLVDKKYFDFIIEFEHESGNRASLKDLIYVYEDNIIADRIMPVYGIVLGFIFILIATLFVIPVMLLS